MYFSLYTANDGKTKIDVKLEEGELNEESGTMTHRNIMGYILNRTMVNMFGCPRSREINTTFSIEGHMVFSMDEVYFGKTSEEYAQTMEPVDV